jgi:hypothetical protein
MRPLFFFLTLFSLFGCTTTPEVSKNTEKESQSKILANHTDAEQAKDEYKQLQAQRDQE